MVTKNEINLDQQSNFVPVFALAISNCILWSILSTFYLQAAFGPIFFRQKISKPNCNFRE